MLTAHLAGERHRFIGALEELDGHEDHLLVAEVLKIVDLELAGAIGLVRPRRILAAENALEKTTVRVADLPRICITLQ